MRKTSPSARVFQYVRRKRKLTQTELAQLLGVNQSTISRIEKSQHRPQLRLINRLEKITAKSFGELYQLEQRQ